MVPQKNHAAPVLEYLQTTKVNGASWWRIRLGNPFLMRCPAAVAMRRPTNIVGFRPTSNGGGRTKVSSKWFQVWKCWACPLWSCIVPYGFTKSSWIRFTVLRNNKQTSLLVKWRCSAMLSQQLSGLVVGINARSSLYGQRMAPPRDHKGWKSGSLHHSRW